MKDALNTLKKQIENARDNIELTLIGMLKYRNITEVDCCEFNSAPVISNNMDTITLNNIELRNVGHEYILFSGSDEYGIYYIPLKSMDIECLIGVYEWVLENQEELF